MKKFAVKLGGIFLAATFLLTGCGSGQDKTPAKTASNEKIQVVASFYPMYDFTKLIGGDKVDVTTLIPSSVEPHDWEPTPQDIVKITKAKVFVYNGASMEGWIDKVKQNSDSKNVDFVEASKGVKLLPGHEEDEDKDSAQKEEKQGQFDPHVWLSPENAKIEMKNIKDALVKVDPSNKDYFEKNYEENAKKLDALNEEYKTELAKTKKKDIIVAHQAFGYLCQAYGLKQVPIEGLSPDSEPDAAKMAEVTKFAKDHDVKYIFFEDLVSPKVAKTIAKESGAKAERLNPIEGLTQQQLDKGENYYTIMEQNLKTLVKALNS